MTIDSNKVRKTHVLAICYYYKDQSNICTSPTRYMSVTMSLRSVCKTGTKLKKLTSNITLTIKACPHAWSSLKHKMLELYKLNNLHVTLNDEFLFMLSPLL